MIHTAEFRSLASGETVLFHRYSGAILPHAAEYRRRNTDTVHIDLEWRVGRLAAYSGLEPLSAYPLLLHALEASVGELPPELVNANITLPCA